MNIVSDEEKKINLRQFEKIKSNSKHFFLL